MRSVGKFKLGNSIKMMCVKMFFTCFVFVMCCLQIVLGIHISNLNDSCLRCLCHVTGCDLSHGCTGGYCGPFYISRVYWVDAGKPTLPDDNPERHEDNIVGVCKIDGYPEVASGKTAYEDCARDYYCSQQIVKGYMAKFGKDCNGDGVTNCFDYMMINHHGGGACSAPLALTTLGLQRLKLYKQCRL